MSIQAAYPYPNLENLPDRTMRCNVRALADLLLKQWKGLSRNEIEATRYRKARIAKLIEDKYGVNHVLAENYLTNIERTLPFTM